jgi:cytochrome c556
MRVVVVACAFALLAACQKPAENNQQTSANKAANASEVASSTVAAAAARPLTKKAALKLMHERHEGMEAVGKANKAIRRALEGTPPDLATVKASAAKLAGLSRKASRWFPSGTGPDVGKTGAKPEIWQSPQDFSARLRDFQAAAKLFNTAAASGEVNAIKARYGDLGKTCKACHDKYRSEMHH